ncbi:SMALL AUXIN-UP RNA-RELATED [Salix koriyanagi]|uniref:SMALL AUXIN-UP RNA-RELATED n=1 Tax=Salix koriyanagi TaxID=2511006 RepID=A0A9Q0PXT0_9ROSI|nr:SMALL AUXIN-UP RNA-RELATED [Salix koriyanagi]
MGVRASKLSKLIGARGVKRVGALGEAEFLELLYKSSEEYGFDSEGILRIAYEAKDFEEWMITGAKGKLGKYCSGIVYMDSICVHMDKTSLHMITFPSKELDNNW